MRRFSPGFAHNISKKSISFVMTTNGRNCQAIKYIKWGGEIFNYREYSNCLIILNTHKQENGENC